MPYHYIDVEPAKRATMPEIEAWEDYETVVKCRKCGLVNGPEGTVNDPDRGVCCPTCNRKAKVKSISYEHVWYSWICIPGCDPDSDPLGPFGSEDDAVNAARAFADAQV